MPLLKGNADLVSSKDSDGETLPFDYHNGEGKVVIAKLGIHGVILVH
jgi:hypothetical protein